MSRSEIEKELGSYSKSTRTTDNQDKVAKAQIAASIKQSSKSGVAIGEVNNGFVSMNQVVDDTDEGVTSHTGQLPVVQMTNQVGGVSSNLQGQASSETQTKLQSVVGDNDLTAQSFNKVVISSGHPDAVAAATQQAVPTATLEQLKEISKQSIDLSSPNLTDNQAVALLTSATSPQDVLNGFIGIVEDVVGDAIQVFKTGNPLFNSISSLKNNVVSSINQERARTLAAINKGFSSTIDNIVEKTTHNGENKLRPISFKDGNPINLPQNEIRRALEFVDAEDYNNAVKAVKPFVDATDNEIFDALKQIDNRASVVTKAGTSTTATAIDVNRANNIWPSDTNYVPDQYWVGNAIPVNESLNLFKNELYNVSREITEVLVASSNTGIDVDLTAQEWNNLMFNQNGRNSSFNYVITKTGRLERLRPLSSQIQSDENQYPNNHHLRSMSILLIGGMIGPHREQDQSFGLSGYNTAQLKTFDAFMKAVYQVYPGMQVMGFNTIGSSLGENPHFDVPRYVESKFNKKLIITDPKSSEPLEQYEIAQGGFK